MSVLKYTHTLLLGGPHRQEYVTAEMEPVQRLFFIIFGIVFILLEGWETPFKWGELMSVIIGGGLIAYGLLFPKFYSPYYLKFNQHSLWGRLSRKKRIHWNWNQIRQLHYTPIKLEVITRNSQIEIELSQVDYKYRKRILSRLLETAQQNNVETVFD